MDVTGCEATRRGVSEHASPDIVCVWWCARAEERVGEGKEEIKLETETKGLVHNKGQIDGLPRGPAGIAVSAGRGVGACLSTLILLPISIVLLLLLLLLW